MRASYQNYVPPTSILFSKRVRTNEPTQPAMSSGRVGLKQNLKFWYGPILNLVTKNPAYLGWTYGELGWLTNPPNFSNKYFCVCESLYKVLKSFEWNN